MAINLYNIKKWCLMLTGKSLFHVNQNMGACFEKGVIRGYFNNMTEKVTKDNNVYPNGIPLLHAEDGKSYVFPVAVFQYGLGAYDLYLRNKNCDYKEKFLNCVQWAVDNQEESGAWENFYYIYPDNPYGAMCQGEGASLLVRAYELTNDETYLHAAERAIEFMLKPLNKGGTAIYEDGKLILLEYTHRAAVLNGWIFAAFGLYDVYLATKKENYKTKFELTIKTISEFLPNFDAGFWSLYDLDERMASPFYHNLHIAQLEALHIVTGESVFEVYKNKFIDYSCKKRYKLKAFVIKAIQKIKE